MEKPNSLMGVTIAGYREVYKANNKIFDHIAVLVVTNALFIDDRSKSYDYDESVLNQLYTELILQQEYIRENWR